MFVLLIYPHIFLLLSKMGIDAEHSGQVVRAAGGSVKHLVFERFFRDVDGCVRLMKTQSAIASGSAVLRALLPEASWEPSDLDLYVGDMKVYGNLHWLLPWIDFLWKEGYRLQDGEGRVQYQESQVCVCFVRGEEFSDVWI